MHRCCSTRSLYCIRRMRNPISMLSVPLRCCMPCLQAGRAAAMAAAAPTSRGGAPAGASCRAAGRKAWSCCRCLPLPVCLPSSAPPSPSRRIAVAHLNICMLAPMYSMTGSLLLHSLQHLAKQIAAHHFCHFHGILGQAITCESLAKQLFLACARTTLTLQHSFWCHATDPGPAIRASSTGQMHGCRLGQHLTSGLVHACRGCRPRALAA